MNDNPNIIDDNNKYTIMKFMLLNIPNIPSAKLISTVMHILIVTVYIIFSISECFLKYLCTMINPDAMNITTRPSINCNIDNISIYPKYRLDLKRLF
jgi:hypothetical protein